MPELPELEVIKEVLQRRAVGQSITAVEVMGRGGAIVVRDLTHEGFERTLVGKTILDVKRRGKFLIFSLDSPYLIVINPKLTGRFKLATPDEKRHARTCLILTLANGVELRYHDQKQMGQVYLTRDIGEVPEFSGMGPEPFALTLDGFRERLRPFRGEIKGVLTRGECIAGIGNAYADEILWAAKIHPYRKRTLLTPDETERLYHAILTTLGDATDKMRVQMGENIQIEPRTFLSVHLKTGEPCPRCGTPISLVGANQRITNFCRTCQPGGLIRGM